MIEIDELIALRDKYLEMTRLRARREQGHPLSAEERDERKQSFRSLAERFPGALRELDGSPAAVLGAKATALEGEIQRARRGEPPARWVEVTIDFHRTLRGILDRKRVQPFRAPGGRTMNLVWAALAARHGLTREALQRLVFGTPEEWPPDHRS